MPQGVPYFKLKIDGAEISADEAKSILTFEIREALNQLDAFTARFVISDQSIGLLKKAMPGVSFEAEIGYESGSACKLKGDIVEAQHRRGAGAPWTLTLHGLDQFHRARDKFHTKIVEGTVSDAVKAMGTEAGLSATAEAVQATGTHVLHLNNNIASTLQAYAKDLDYFVRVEEGTKLKFSRLSSASKGAVTVTWGEELEDVSLRASLEGIVTEVTAIGYDYKKVVWNKGVGASSKLKKISGGKTGVALLEAKFGATKILLDNQAISQTSGLKERAEAELLRRAERFVSGKAVCVGVPDAMAGAKLTIKNAGWPLAGDFLIKETAHTYEPGSGYKTTIHFYSDSLPA